MRAKGAGTKRPDGRWGREVTLTDQDGKKKRVVVYGDTQAEMQANVRHLLLETGGKAPTPWTVRDLIAFCQSQGWGRVGNEARDQYNWASTRILADLGDLPVQAFRPTHAAKFLKSLIGTMAGSSVGHHRKALSCMMRIAVEEGWIDVNPIREIRTPVSTKPVARPVPTEAEWRKIYESEPNPIKRDLWRFLGETGLRPFVEGVVAAKSGLLYSRDMYWYKVGASKTEAGQERIVPLSDVLGARFYEREGELLFPSEVGTILMKRNVQRSWKAAIERAGIEKDFPLKSLRNLALTRWSRNLPADITKILAGHTKFALTMDVYARLSKADIINGFCGASQSEPSQSIDDYLGRYDTD